ncbi:mycofactocin-coupled SDR family oxidoreductase [Gordonia terrae]|uniref:3-oxoacyl-[acyl-carrier-protein] reductase MabA n=2 Tax=Gordonia terrae TaxID=2055 RepID=A0AAD0K8R6_9ACTN|nr:mycofactocin-coupled SDR family oxidoreductase [Gordonia terrae]VTR09587.1 3-oxoacyl-(acyl-carrier-protein) reductase [Clostridioides difficile]ANY22198.1 3-ketoacyl-ACP reductase [Gordonia terrae]AWO82939.1 NAD(P)-dependent oxidoreductase [Gordonia terrae]VTS29547.1 (-)-trans-carveol dehydrogenase [Gordonia terrae]GAB46335.1 putative oxidoreductase [Gordonia terrae NBRC 100016]
MCDLTGRTAWVTGAARGQGRAHARALAAAGAHVIVSDIARQIDSVSYELAAESELAATVGEIVAAGGRATAAQLDVRDSQAVNVLVADIMDHHGRLDVLVANAGICGFSPVDRISDEQWADMVDTNLTGTFNCVRAAVGAMKTNGFGRIIGVSSGAGRGGMNDLSHYAATKWGVIGLIKSVALEVGSRGITANVVCPTSVATPMVMNESTLRRFRPDLDKPTPEDARAVFAGLGPLGVPWLEPEDVTRAVMYLVGDPGLTTGTVLEVNLGTTATRT